MKAYLPVILRLILRRSLIRRLYIGRLIGRQQRILCRLKAVSVLASTRYFERY